MVRTRKLKDGTIAFYDGNKKATEKQAKQFIKENTSLIDKDTLKDVGLRKYYGAVKGGQNRAKNALYDVKTGRMLSGSIQEKAIKNLGIDLERLSELKGVNNIRDLFKNAPEIKKRFDKLQDTGISYWYAADKVKGKLETYTGSIFINGKEYDAKNGWKKVRDTLSAIKREVGNIDAAIEFKYKGMNRLDIKLPSKSEIEEFENNGDIDGIELYISSKGKKK